MINVVQNQINVLFIYYSTGVLWFLGETNPKNNCWVKYTTNYALWFLNLYVKFCVIFDYAKMYFILFQNYFENDKCIVETSK